MDNPKELCSPLEGALYLFDKGLQVFPLARGTKVPPKLMHWQKWAAEATRESVIEYDDDNPGTNWGVHCGTTGHTGLDLDKKPGAKGERNGIDSMAHIMQEEGQVLPVTLTVRTPTGGLHLYFEGYAPNTNDTIGTGIETRGEGQYLVAPGSIIKGVAYEIIRDYEPAIIPKWFADIAAEVKKDKVTIADDGVIPKGEQHATLVSFAGTMRSRGMSEDAIYAALMVVNEQQLEEQAPEANIREIARTVASYAPSHAIGASDFLEPVKLKAITVDTINPIMIPKRDWIMDGRYIGGFINVVISPGGAGKSTLTMLDAVAIATGQPLTGFLVIRPGNVWLYNTEDPLDELKRRFIAISMAHSIPLYDMRGIHVTSGREQPFILAKNSGNDGVIINRQAIEEAITYINHHDIRVLIADPFVRTHEVSENDNMQIDKVVWCFQRIADKTGCAICLVHHTSKGAYTPGEMDKARGASALVSAARIAHTVSTMSVAEAQHFAITAARRPWYMRLDNAKSNLKAPMDKADWYEKVSILLANGDSVGTIKRSVLVDISAQKEEESLAAEALDLARCLSEFMKVGEVLKVTDLYDQVITSPKYAHVFGGITSKDRGKQKLTKLLKAGAAYGGKVFDYLFDPEARSKHWVVCNPNDMDFLN